MTASELYALSQGYKNGGVYECHWCGSACDDLHMHDDPPPVPFVKGRTTARRPNCLWVCRGCWNFRRKRITIQHLGGGYADGKAAMSFPWWITEQGACVPLPASFPTLYEHLLSPPLRFSLSLLRDAKAQSCLHLMVCNDLKEIKANTPLHYTIDNVMHSYTVYELEEGLTHGVEGKDPGVRALVALLGPFDIVAKKATRGRPAKEDEGAEKLRRTVAKKE